MQWNDGYQVNQWSGECIQPLPPTGGSILDLWNVCHTECQSVLTDLSHGKKISSLSVRNKHSVLSLKGFLIRPSWESLTNYGQFQCYVSERDLIAVWLCVGKSDWGLVTGSWWSGSQISIAWHQHRPLECHSVSLDRGETSGVSRSEGGDRQFSWQTLSGARLECLTRLWYSLTWLLL